ncbi:MAG: hydantoinase B/oxoprolinase family protein [Salinisphaeraceae bacterium]|nr:hydantoinase B/oxoprolinase family protein [Salinisphaeraceae bacterium]
MSQTTTDAIELSLFSNRINAVCEQMGALLQRAAFSPNIRDRLDFSCAVFDPQGELCAQAAHIPVHLGSMAYAMRDIVASLSWEPGDMVVVNDPYLGGTHLPDVTLIAPAFVGDQLVGFVANRAHHADIGAESPGSMPISQSLEEEGMLLAPSYLYKAGQRNEALFENMLAQTTNAVTMRGDFAAQVSANHLGVKRLCQLAESVGSEDFAQRLVALNAYAQRLAQTALSIIPVGEYAFTDVMDDDGLGQTDIRIQLSLRVQPDGIELDFSGTAGQVAGNINCPLSVTAAAAYYCFRCLMPPETPACAGSFRALHIRAPKGSLINAERPAAVAAGNVETSSRIVDVVLGALAQAIPDVIPAASHGGMNNLAMGSHEGERHWDYYETIGGGMGASSKADGLSAVQTHMTNTLNTPIEVLEMNYPLRVTEYAIRSDSGGAGTRSGGDGIVREYEFLAPAQATLLTERRRHAPWGLQGGEAGKAGENCLNGETLGSKQAVRVKAGDRLRIATPGGGGHGKPYG